MDKFVIRPSLHTKRVGVESHARADSESVCASELEEGPPMKVISTSRSTAAASMMSNVYIGDLL